MAASSNSSLSGSSVSSDAEEYQPPIWKSYCFMGSSLGSRRMSFLEAWRVPTSLEKASGNQDATRWLSGLETRP
uniref:Chimerin 2 n=1 Tax=Homo sapiens TaxID=9606 RepID=A0A994J7Z1_HUMAN